MRVGGRQARVPCVCACAYSPWLGRAGRPPGRVLVRLTFSFGRFCFLLCLAPSWLGWPPSGFFFSFRCCLLRAPFVSCSLWFPAPGALGLGAVCCLSRWPRTSRPSVRSPSFCVARLAVGCCLVVASPPPFCVSRFFLSALRSLFFFSLFAPPLSPVSSGLRPGMPWALALCFAFFFPPASRLSVCSRSFYFLLGRWLLLGAWCPPLPLCVAGFIAPARCPPPFFFFPCVRPCCLWLSLVSGPGCPEPWRCVLFTLWASRFSAPRALSPFSVSRLAVGCSLVVAAPFFFFFCIVCPRCLRLSLVSGPECLGPRRCALFALLASRFLARHAFSPLSCLPSGRWLLLGGCCPPPPFVSRCFRRFCSVLCAVCCAVLCVPGCGAALRCCALCRPMLCCCVLCCFAALGLCRCSSCRPLWCCPSPWGPVLCGAVFCKVPPRFVCFVVAWWCVLLFAALYCAVCVLGCCAVCSLSSPLCAVLCFAVLVRLHCAVRVVRAVAGARCCGALPCVVLFPLVCCGAVLGLIARGCLLVPCCGALPLFCFAGGFGLCLFPVCAVLCCAARRVVRFWLSLRCCRCLVLWRVPVCCGVSLGVLRCCGAALVCRGVLLCCALSCGDLRPVLCPAVLCCLAVLCWWAVLCGCLRCWCLFFLLSSFPLLKTPAVFPCL